MSLKSFHLIFVTLLTAWPLLHEVPTGWQIGGAAGIFAALGLIRS